MDVNKAHKVPHGPSLVEKMAAKLDAAYVSWADGINDGEVPGSPEVEHMYGRVEGCAAQLGILRSSSTQAEIDAVKERYES